MLLTIGIILLVCWALGLFAFHAGGIIHLLIVLAVVAFIAHLFMGRRTVA
ncbi:MAG: lmo0937 family membrane protein [Acidobacteriota bacterium]